MAVLYLDIDGPLLRSATPGAGQEIAPHAGTLLRWAIECHTPYWLITRDRSGSHAGIVRAFRECRNWDAALEPLLLRVTPFDLGSIQGRRHQHAVRLLLGRRRSWPVRPHAAGPAWAT